MRALRAFGSEALRDQIDVRLVVAGRWLAGSEAKTQEDRAFRLLGLKWTDRDDDEIEAAAEALLAEQRITPEQLDAQNAAHATDFAGIDKATVLDLARDGGQAAAAALRTMSGTQLAESAEFFGQSTTAAEVAENILVGHVLGHLESFKATTGQS